MLRHDRRSLFSHQLEASRTASGNDDNALVPLAKLLVRKYLIEPDLDAITAPELHAVSVVAIAGEL